MIVDVSAGSISVRDEGKGVPEPLRSKIFEPFITGRTRGLGLGATVAKRCQQRQDGDIVLQTTGPEGSVFVLTWPRA